jgi:hypothetical protein
MKPKRPRWPSGRTAAVALAVVLLALAGWLLVPWTRSERPGPAPVAPVVVGSPAPTGAGLTLPKKIGSLRFAVMGDVGRGDRAQYDTANQMWLWHERFDFSFVLMLGDNLYAEQGTPEQYAIRFEAPYKALLDHGVTFYAALGNHDPPGETQYPPFNMDGNRYYTFTKEAGPPLAREHVAFFALDTVTLDNAQLTWLRRMLAASRADWKIGFYHHPLYTSGRYSYSAARLRTRLEPIFVPYGLDVGFSGHEHFYERIVPQRGIQYFTSGGGGALRRGDIRQSNLTAAGFDQDTHFLLVEIAGDTMYFQAISRIGETVDAGQLTRAKHPPPPAVLR